MTVEKLEALGVERMAEGNIKDFLNSKGIGVLALSSENAPYVLPLAYGYDGNRRLYFTYFVGETSRKADLSDDDPQASFLVYAAESPFTWRSVVCVGRIRPVPRSDWGDHQDAMERKTWRPDVLTQGFDIEHIQHYQLDIDEWSGLRQRGLPPGFAAGGG